MQIKSYSAADKKNSIFLSGISVLRARLYSKYAVKTQ